MQEQNVTENQKLKPCRNCEETDYWQHIDGRILCGVCHPRIDGLEKKGGDASQIQRNEKAEVKMG